MAQRPFSALATAVASLTVVLAVAGCATAPDPPPAQAVRDASAATLAAGTATTTYDARMDYGDGKAITVRSSGVLDLARQNADVRVRREVLRREPQEMDETVFGDVAYGRFTPEDALFWGRPWLALDLVHDAVPEIASGFVNVGAGNPVDPVAALGRLSDDTRVLGSEPVDGVRCTHYAGTLDLARPVPGEDPARTAAADRARAVLGVTTLSVDAWVGDDGRLRRVDQRVVVPARAGLGPATVTGSVRLSGFGTPFTATPPPADQVARAGGSLPW